jgi:predicted AAA+ superfamily ATPase
MFTRSLKSHINSDLKQKMVFIGGPRQVGKTTFSFEFLKNGSKSHQSYYNWDIVTRRKEILKGTFPVAEKLIVLDEVHKYARWRNLLKGFYDEYYPRKNFLVTGSARLDYYRKGGDSLIGRYHYHRLHPVSLLELNSNPTITDVETLLQYSGFPEPLIKSSEKFLRRWQLERADRVLREDLRDLERVREISLLEILLDALPSRVGSPLSIRSLQEDVEVAHESISKWLSIFESLYLTYRISPFGAERIKAVKKEQKLYFWDWSTVQESGARFENFMASQLLKYCHFLQDTEGYKMELRYLRDREKREVDFVVVKNKKPLFAVEAKLGEDSLLKQVAYFAERTDIPVFYQVHMGTKDYELLKGRIRVIPANIFCKEVLV